MVDLPDSVAGTAFADYDNSSFSFDADRLAHFAGRSCYQAWDMPREETANDVGYLDNIIKQGHFSVLEHASATFYIEGISRNLTHELIRHRHLSYSELSQRFVDVSEMDFITPPAVIDGFPHKLKGAHMALDDYEYAVSQLTAQGLTGKKLREATRAYLPSGMETKIVVTGNHRAWRDMLQKRYSVHADAEICELSSILLIKLRELAPATYQDFPKEPFQ
jgi:thymidylate synthase (FAD)